MFQGDGAQTRTEEESFQVIKLEVPEADQEISLNNVIANHYAEASSTLFMKCRECCPHKGICPQTGNCKLMPAVSQRTLISTPKYLFIQLWRFPSHQSLKVKTKVCWFCRMTKSSSSGVSWTILARRLRAVIIWR